MTSNSQQAALEEGDLKKQEAMNVTKAEARRDPTKPSDVHVAMMIVGSLFLVVAAQSAGSINPESTARVQLMWLKSAPPDSRPNNLNHSLQELTLRIQFMALWSIVISVYGITIEYALDNICSIFGTDTRPKRVTVAALKTLSFFSIVGNLIILVSLCFMFSLLAWYVSFSTSAPPTINQQLIGPADKEKAIIELELYLNGTFVDMFQIIRNAEIIVVPWTNVIFAQMGISAIPLLSAIVLVALTQMYAFMR